MNHFILIDQAAICGAHDWTNADLSNVAAPYILPPHMKKQIAFSDVEPLVEEIKLLAEEDIHACFDSCPDEWAITDVMVNKATEFLVKRRAHLAKVLQDSLK